MALFTAAIAAVSAAIATTTVATVATAVVAVSAAVGVAGLAVTAVGVVTKNQDLMKAGKIMGYVGLAGGLAGGVIGGVGGAMSSTGTFATGFADAYAGYSQILEKSWNEGVGSWFSSGSDVAKGASATPGGPAPIASSPPPAGGTSGGLAAPSGPTDMSTALNNPTADVLASQQAAMGGAPAPAAAPVQTPVTPGVSAPVAQANPLPGYVGPGASPIPGGAPAAASKGLFESMPDWAKYSMMTTGGQGLSGLASGYFHGLSAEESLKQRQLENQQTQNQIQLLNRQGSYAPLIQFRQPDAPGLAGVGRA